MRRLLRRLLSAILPTVVFLTGPCLSEAADGPYGADALPFLAKSSSVVIESASHENVNSQGEKPTDRLVPSVFRVAVARTLMGPPPRSDKVRVIVSDGQAAEWKQLPRRGRAHASPSP
jgi:hypothetical protein